MNTVGILEGWAGGPKLSKRFRKAISERGFKVTKKLEEADFIFAHSTGCYLLPGRLRAKVIFMIDPPYWPGRRITGRWFDLIKNDRRLLKSDAGSSGFLSKKLWELFYIIKKPRFSWSVIRNQSHLDFLGRLDYKRIVLIRNKNDEFCSPAISDQLKSYKNIKYIELPGHHEDYYVNPSPYIDLLLKEL